jgi:hypothetical protein
LLEFGADERWQRHDEREVEVRQFDDRSPEVVQGRGREVADLDRGPVGVLGDERSIELILAGPALLAAAVFGLTA